MTVTAGRHVITCGYDVLIMPLLRWCWRAGADGCAVLWPSCLVIRPVISARLTTCANGDSAVQVFSDERIFRFLVNGDPAGRFTVTRTRSHWQRLLLGADFCLQAPHLFGPVERSFKMVDVGNDSRRPGFAGFGAVLDEGDNLNRIFITVSMLPA